MKRTGSDLQRNADKRSKFKQRSLFDCFGSKPDNASESVPSTDSSVRHEIPSSTSSSTTSRCTVDIVAADKFPCAKPKMDSDDIEKEDNLQPHLTSSQNTAIAQWPSVWSEDEWIAKQQLYPWLESKGGKLGCKTCASVNFNICARSAGAQLSSPWQRCEVTYNGKTKKEKLRGLRKEIFKHRTSETHTQASKAAEKRVEESLGRAIDRSNEMKHESTCKIFNSAYHLALYDRPYSDFPGLIELQESNGVNLGTGLHSRYSGTEILDHISDEMRTIVCANIKKEDGKISVLIDEATTISNKTVLIVNLKCEVEKSQNPEFIFLDLLELPNKSADTICNSLLTCLDAFGFDDAYLSRNLVAFASDGASTMLGSKSGVATKLQTKYPNLIIWHCLNHRLELSVGDAVKQIKACNHFKSFMDKLYTVYSRSPHNEQQLKNCAAQLDVQLRKIGRVLNTRWVSSSYRTVSAVWDNIPALAAHFKEASLDLERSSQDRATYTGLLKRTISPEFLLDLGLMHDTLFELSALSEYLQHRDTTIVSADRMMRRTIRRLEKMQTTSGTKLQEAQEAQISLKKDEMQLVSNPSHVGINVTQFLDALVNSMSARLFCTKSSKASASSAEKDAGEYSNLLQHLSILEKERWPVPIDVDYGESSVKCLCRRFHLPEVKTLNAFRDYVEDDGVHIHSDLKLLMNCKEVIPCSSSECERGFSAMNLIVTPRRSPITIKHVSSLLFLKLHGPPLSNFNPARYVRSWLRNHRCAEDPRMRKVQKPSEKRKQVKQSCIWKLL